MSEPITEEWCQTVGLNKMTWNPKMNGGTPEYWVTTWQGKRDAYREWDSRLAIRFRWEPGEDFRVMLTAPNTGVWLHGVTTVEQFQQVYELITGKTFVKAVKAKRKREELRV